MKKLTSLLIFVGLAINVSGQEEPKNLKEAFKADWLIGTWESTNDDGQVSGQTFGWKIQDVLMVRESTGNDGKVRSFATISLDKDAGKVLMHYHSTGNGTSISELKVDGDKVISVGNWKRGKLSQEEVESRIESFVESRLASGAVQEEGVAELKQNVINYYNNRKTSGMRKITYEKQGADKMVTTFANKDESGQFVDGDPVTWTRK